MVRELKLPELGENIESAGVIAVLVKAGDKLQKDQGVIEIETDKATIEVPSDAEGVIKEVLVKEGDQIKVGQTLVTIEEGKESDQGTDGSEEKTVSDKKPDKEKQVESNKEEDKPKKESGSRKEKVDETAAPVVRKTSGKSESVDINLPELGENIESADVLNVLVKKGDMIEKDQSIIEIETDKATIEVPSTIKGKVIDVLIKPGDKAKVGATLIRVESEGVVEEAVKQTEKKKELEKTSKPEEFTKETSASAGKKDVEKKDAVQEKPPHDGKGKIEKLQPGEIDDQPPIIKNAAPAAPSVRRLARELGIDINEVKGSGSSNRISMSDVKAHVKRMNQERETGGIRIAAEALPDFSKYGEVERKPMSKIRSVTADHLSYAWSVIPHVTQHDKADITQLEKIRKQLNPKVEEAGGKLTITSILISIIVAGMKKFPQFNSSIDMDKHEVIYKNYINIGVAVDTEHGLMVPVIKNADQKNLIEISIELNTLAEKARSRKISLEDLQGGCFTITNLGGIGGTSFTPIVNSPEVAILGVSRGSYEPVYKDDKFIPKLLLPLSLSYDHRIIDGADAARFLRWVCETLEQPINLILE